MVRNSISSVTLLLLSLPLFGAAPQPATPAIDWMTNYHEAIARAKKLGKPIIVDFYADWCGPCHLMDEQTFTDPEVILAMQDFVNVKVNIDVDEKTAFAYGVRSIPRTVVINTFGEMVGDRVGFMEVEFYLAYLKDVSEYTHTQVDGTVITVPAAVPETVSIAPDADFTEVMALLSNPEAELRAKAQEAVLALDKKLLRQWMEKGLTSDYLGDRIAAKDILLTLDRDTYAAFDPWAPVDERTQFLQAIVGFAE